MIHAKLTNLYHENLMRNCPAVMKYLYSRGIYKSTIEYFKIGYCNNDIGTKFLSESEEELLDSGLFRKNDVIHDLFNGRITTPLISSNKVVYMTSRLFPGNGMTHLHQHGSIQAAVNFDILKEEQIVIVEGPFDCFTLHQNGIPSIGLLGANRISLEIIEKLRNKKVYIAFDNDPNQAGQKAAKRLAEKLYNHKISARIVVLPESKEKMDVNLYFQTHNKSEFLELVKESRSMNFDRKTTNTKLNNRIYSILTVAEEYGLPVKQMGNYYKCPCPFHEETTPSLTFYPQTGSFYCFGCSASGDALELVKKLEILRGNRYSFNKIIEITNKIKGI